ncbi:MAG: glycogen debranching protein GlgX [Anaerolineales bacterium]|nr:glycogen debranching protein GlgX [Anaerolineales bacterium]
MQRIDAYPTHKHGAFLLRAGRPFPFGASFVPGGVNFSVFSRHATKCTLVLFHKGEMKPIAEIPFPDEFRIGHVFAMAVFDLDYESIEYGYRMDGPYEPHNGHWFNYENILIDPYAKGLSGRNIWAETNGHDTNHNELRSLLVYDDFDWQTDRPLEKPVEELITYEMHVRGFTRHPSSGVKHPGTFAGMREKIPYLKELGVNCVELMPIQEFDELENNFVNPQTGSKLHNYWGYSQISFFAPKAGYAATGALGMQADELKALIKLLHQNDIEVFLDVVFNHTAEIGGDGPTISYRGLDNKTYYMLKPDGSYFNFSGCGNTMNCNNPVVRSMVLDCLRYWAAEFHIDGFRFDLASILGRDIYGTPLANPPLLEALAYDPILGRCKLIAEAWDAGGLYQVGSFPAYGRWGEWNGKYRDTLRKFVKGDMGQLKEMAKRIEGSPDLYAERGPTASVNFITCHDGFTLLDLFSYNEKHNEANGENGRDGANDNNSWNCGWEGVTDDPDINQLRRRLIKNSAAILLMSRGVPLIHMGDEIGHTKEGNNNTYCQDNALNWFNWAQVAENNDIFQFFKHCIAFRKAHPILRKPDFPQHKDAAGSGFPEISWHGLDSWNPDWADYNRTMAFMLCGRHVTPTDDDIYVGMNMHWESHIFELPRLRDGAKWHVFANTSLPAPNDICPPGQEIILADQTSFLIGARSIFILVGRIPRENL